MKNSKSRARNKKVQKEVELIVIDEKQGLIFEDEKAIILIEWADKISDILPKNALKIIFKKTSDKNRKILVEKLAKEIGLKGYARIDAFMNVSTGDLLIIEVNTLPGLTPSTVFYHQALAENPPIFPLALLEKIIKNSGY